jgi:hypothetical protein
MAEAQPPSTAALATSLGLCDESRWWWLCPSVLLASQQSGPARPPPGYGLDAKLFDWSRMGPVLHPGKGSQGHPVYGRLDAPRIAPRYVRIGGTLRALRND